MREELGGRAGRQGGGSLMGEEIGGGAGRRGGSGSARGGNWASRDLVVGEELGAELSVVARAEAATETAEEEEEAEVTARGWEETRYRN